jgi:hypothetical protein
VSIARQTWTHSLADGREVEAESGVLLLVPGGADAEDGAAAGDHVEGGDHLGEQRRVPVGHAGDERAEPDALRAGGERAEQRVALEDGLVRTAQRGQLPEMVHHPHRLESAVLGGASDLGDVFEHLAIVDAGELEVRELQTEGRGHSRRPLDDDVRRHGSYCSLP